jgi:AraC-like DNA-binding protein
MAGGAKNMTAGSSKDAKSEGPTVGAGFARGLLEFAVSKGASREELLARSQIAAEDIADPDNRLPFAKYVTLMRAGIALSGDPALGLHFGQLNLSRFSIVGLIGRGAETIEEALGQLNRYVRLIVEAERAGPGDRFQIIREKSEAWLVDTRLNANVFPELTESAFSQLISRTKELPHDPNRPLVKVVHVTHARPAHWEEYERVFGAPVVFASDRNAFLIDEEVLSWRIAFDSPYVYGVLKERADTLLDDLERLKTMRGRLEDALMPILHTGAGVEEVAKRLGLSRQTLFRRLKAEGATFEKVLDELRHRMALHYLGEKKLSVNETGYLVGFSDATAFSRAFKRWTGKTPKEMRG